MNPYWRPRGLSICRDLWLYVGISTCCADCLMETNNPVFTRILLSYPLLLAV
ncbi:hypothetical protein PF005_g5017 [Phytophthora fragariae]|uniref:Uncharacterized protein n=2 Tax=Phytophthora TaxID=4783 RepID=A0A6A4A412_9STRA|nr:hypothetical protein PF003_g34708 [Phytophthora fragariae]KAE8980368.1 hypothetical protein PR002_g24152 [Phytophthora rubi]KAE8945373.1 hypothetical protein PF009_g4957 [Phytophthora fragariae]KAE8984001.1 hypothetical protein PR001_g23296 [Phytophthora rubi]KAE9022577.1 hypothetical protein PF011_g4398 [Phytophthora fragariae]